MKKFLKFFKFIFPSKTPKFLTLNDIKKYDDVYIHDYSGWHLGWCEGRIKNVLQINDWKTGESHVINIEDHLNDTYIRFEDKCLFVNECDYKNDKIKLW